MAIDRDTGTLLSGEDKDDSDPFEEEEDEDQLEEIDDCLLAKHIHKYT